MFLIGLFAGMVFFLCVLAAFYVGYRIGKNEPQPKDDSKKNDVQQHFAELMSYDVHKALQRKKVT